MTNSWLDKIFWKVLWYASQHDSAVLRFLKAYIYNNYSLQNPAQNWSVKIPWLRLNWVGGVSGLLNVDIRGSMEFDRCFAFYGLLRFRAHTDYYQLRRLPPTVQANTLYWCTVLTSYVSITLAPLSCYSCSWFLAARCKITNLFLPIMCLSFGFEVKSLHNFSLF